MCLRVFDTKRACVLISLIRFRGQICNVYFLCIFVYFCVFFSHPWWYACVSLQKPTSRVCVFHENRQKHRYTRMCLTHTFSKTNVYCFFAKNIHLGSLFIHVNALRHVALSCIPCRNQPGSWQRQPLRLWLRRRNGKRRTCSLPLLSRMQHPLRQRLRLTRPLRWRTRPSLRPNQSRKPSSWCRNRLWTQPWLHALKPGWRLLLLWRTTRHAPSAKWSVRFRTWCVNPPIDRTSATLASPAMLWWHKCNGMACF